MRRVDAVNYKDNFRKYLKFVAKYKGLVATLVVLSFLLEALYISDKFLFKIIIDNGTNFASGILTSNIYARILLGVAAAYLSIGLAKVVFTWFRVHMIHYFEASIILDLKKKYFNHLIGLSHNFHTTHKTGALISRLNRGAGAIERMSDFIIFNTLPLVFQIVIVGGSIIYFDASTAVVIVATSLVFVGYSLVVLRKQKPANLQANSTEDIEKANISDFFTNIDSIKYFGKDSYIEKKYAELGAKSKRTILRHWFYYRWFDSGHVLILTVGTFFLIYFPLVKFLDGGLSIGTIVFIYTIYGNLFGPLFGFVHSIRGFYRSMADLEDLFSYGKIENEIKDKSNAPDFKVINGEIEFRDVSFGYKNRVVFNKFNLEVSRNKKVALVGHSGSGKTTLVKLLYRLYDVDKGSILIDGQNIKDFKQQSLRSELSIVPQECVLFDDTIYNNILFSRPNATRAEVIRAIKFAQLDEFIKKLPEKENTVVGERGVRLSGGEKQRVSIARALLANKKILVLDEATSSLDSQTEHEIQKDLQKLMQGRTSIIIAHRLSTIMHADIIVVLEKGKIVQQGTHNELIRKQGLYRKLWDLQKGGYIADSGDD